MPAQRPEELVFQPATRLASLLRAGDLSPVELLEAYLARIEAVNPRLNAFVTLAVDRAREQAGAAEARLRAGRPLGPLDGVPVSIKDTLDTAGIRTVAGTRLRESFVPEADAPAVAALARAGAIILGKTNVPECAFDFRSENVVFGRTNNPWNVERVPGGSSGGEAAAIAAGCSAAGLGSDLGGSIRVPAHFCGICGLKPTPGRVPGSGHFPPAAGPVWQAVSIGPLARYTQDLKLLFKVLAVFDPDDPMSVPLAVREVMPVEMRWLRVMWYTYDGITPVTAASREAVAGAARALGAAGLVVEERRPSGIERAFDLWYTWLVEFGVPGIVALYDGREELMGPLLSALRGARPVSFDRWFHAWLDRDRLRASVLREMEQYPILLCPVSATPAFPHGHRGAFDVEGSSVDYLKAFSYAEAFNLLGLPAAVVPCGRSPEGLPIGVQIAGRPYEDERVLAVAAMLEEALGGYQPPPDP